MSLKRSEFKRKPPAPHAKAERVAQVYARLTVPVRYPVFIDPVSIPKESPVRHEGYRRLVAMLPCVFCGIVGYSQAAHPPPTGKGIKEDDRECFPLCCTRPGITGCHVEFDQYRLIPKAEMRDTAAYWGGDTREIILLSGRWPDDLPWIVRKLDELGALNITLKRLAV